MKCPAGEALLACAEGAPDDSQHLASCRSCALQVQRLRALASALQGLSLAQPAPTFTAALRRRMAAPRRSSWRNPLLAAASLCAALAMLVLGRALPDVRGTFSVRGASGAKSQRLGFEVYVHEPGRPPARLERDQQVSAAAGYSFVVWNRSHAAQHVMLFAVDAAREVHWFYPAFVDPATDPQSIEVAATPEVRALAEGVTPDHAAPGPIEFVGLFTAAALRVSSVEALIRERGPTALARAHNVLAIQVWRASVRAP